MSVATQPASSGHARFMRGLLFAFVALTTAIVLIAPFVAIFMFAFSSGLKVYWQNLIDPATRHAVWLTVLTALVVVPINTLFGIAAAWAVTKFTFRGKTLLIALIELPYSVSPIVAGVAYLFVYGTQGLLGPLLESWDIKLMFALPGIFLASMFVTAPYVARELIALMQTQGNDEEEASLSLGASGFATFWRVTLPNIRWGLLYGAILCNARVMGEFGAVSVVSGNIRGVTNTLPLQIELLFHDYNIAGAFAAASVLTLVALVTVLIRSFVERTADATH